MSVDPGTCARDVRCTVCGCRAGDHRVHSHVCTNRTDGGMWSGLSCGCTGFEPEPRPHHHPCPLCYEPAPCDDLRCAVELDHESVEGDPEPARPHDMFRGAHDVCASCVRDLVRTEIDEPDCDSGLLRALIGEPLHHDEEAS